ncbi:COP9 signalosome catalytic subunit rri1, partial [Coemansia sp. RSA 1836]
TESDGFQSVPLNKIEDFGVHADKYYPLEVGYFKSSLDQQLMERLWRKHWVATLSQSPLITNGEFTTLKMLELAEKVSIFSKDAKKNVSAGQIVRESDAIAEEVGQGHASNTIKGRLFGGA